MLFSASIAFLLPLTTRLVGAIPARQAPNYPPHSQSQNFNLVVNVTDPNCDLSPSINNWFLTSYHVGAGEAYAVLDQSQGRIFIVNGTAEEVRNNEADVLTFSGTPSTIPTGVSIDPKNVTNTLDEHTVHIDVGSGEHGIGLANFPNPIPLLKAPIPGSFYACNNTLLYGPAIQLLYRYEGESTPLGCADVTLLPQCVVNGTVEEYANTVNCYEDVAGIDWDSEGYSD